MHDLGKIAAIRGFFWTIGPMFREQSHKTGTDCFLLGDNLANPCRSRQGIGIFWTCSKK